MPTMTKDDKAMTLKELGDRLGGRLTGPGERVIRAVNGLEEAGGDEVAFLANVRYEKFMAATGAGAVIVGEDYAGPGTSLIRCKDPYFAFRQAMVLLHGFREHPFSGVDALARIDATARLGEAVAVGPFAAIAANVQVGPRTVIYPGAYVADECRIGADCVLYPNVVLYDRTVLGDRVTIHAGSVIGEDGFGYATHGGRHEKIPPAGWVEIGDDVEIGACCAIDRATMGATVIGAGTKFSNLVTIGHGTKVGKACLFVAQVGVAGSTSIGDYCALAGQVGVVGHIRIGNRVRVGGKSGVVGDVPDGQEVLGVPALPLAQGRKVFSVITKLPELRAQVRKLAAEVEQLRRQIAEGGKT